MTLDIIKRSLVSLISFAVLVYALYLLVTWATVAPAEHSGMNIFNLLIVMAVACYVGVVYGLYPIYHPYQKRIFLILGIGLIFYAHSYMINNLDTHVYVADITKLFAVLIIWFGGTGLLSKTKIIQDQKKHKNIEIIEA